MLARDPNAYVIRAAGPCPTRPAMPNHVTNTTCTASRANGASPASLLPTHPRSAASTRPAPPRSTTHASSLVPPAGLPAGGTTPLSPAPVYKLEGSQFVRSLPAPSLGALVRGIKRRLPLGHDGAVGRPATLRRTASAAEIRDTVRALFEGTGQPRGPRSPPADGCAGSEEPATRRSTSGLHGCRCSSR